MVKTASILVDQACETDVTELSYRWGRVRYAYARANETRQANERGQDCLLINILDSAVSFALCDGVSMSFMGDLAASYLAGQILADFPGPLNGKMLNGAVEEALAQYMQGLTQPAEKLIQDYPLPDHLLPLVRSVLEEKRSRGSESMFLYGLLDFQSGVITLAWMGDSRLRLWRHSREITGDCLGVDSFQTGERWSTHLGLIGKLHTWQGALSSVTRLAAYSDGLGAYDERLAKPVDTAKIRQMIETLSESPTSDDISFLELDF